MSPLPRFSIVTIAYNDLLGLSRTVASVDRQSHEDWEHLIVDGGSSDGTAEWLATQSQDARRIWTSEPDRGIYDAMNKGLSKAHGELVVVLNAGDCLPDDRTLDTVARSYREHGWAWCYGAVRFTAPSGQPIGAYAFDPFHRTKFVMGLNWIPHATVYMTNALTSEVGSYREDLGTAADQEFLMRALQLHEPFVISWFLADFERGGVSQSDGSRGRELAWHRMRAETGQLWKNNAVLDRMVSEVLTLRIPARKLAKRLGGSR